MKIVPDLNHDLFSFTKAMKDGWQMNGRWKEGGLMIELFKTTRASTKFDRMIPSGSSWVMGIRVQRVFDQAHAAMDVEKPQFSIGLISSCADQYNSCALLKSKIVCLHVSFSTYDYFYKLSEGTSFSRWLPYPVT